MAPGYSITGLQIDGLPRASGDGPPVMAAWRSYMRVAPRERGWPLKQASDELIQFGCPARAGMAPTNASAGL